MVASPGSPLELRDGITSAGELDSRPRVQLASRTCEGVEAGFVCANRRIRSPLQKQGAVAQLGERLICIQEVVGSIPISSTRPTGL